MALNKSGLKTTLIGVFTKQYKGDLSNEQEKEIETLAEDLSDAIDSYIKTATVTVATAIPVTTAVAGTVGTGATTSPGTGTIS